MTPLGAKPLTPDDSACTLPTARAHGPEDVVRTTRDAGGLDRGARAGGLPPEAHADFPERRTESRGQSALAAVRADINFNVRTFLDGSVSGERLVSYENEIRLKRGRTALGGRRPRRPPCRSTPRRGC